MIRQLYECFIRAFFMPTTKLKPLDQVRVKGVDAYVLEVKNRKATLQLEDGSKFTAPVSECLRWRHGRGGRPPKLDKNQYGQITCVLRLDTIELLREGANSKHFGEFLQDHLDRYPPPSREQYMSIAQNVPYYTRVKRNKKVPVIMVTGGFESKEAAREAKKLAREQARRDKLSPKERAWEDQIKESVTKIVDAYHAGNKPGKVAQSQ
jgi:hypothetical protein